MLHRAAGLRDAAPGRGIGRGRSNSGPGGRQRSRPGGHARGKNRTDAPGLTLADFAMICRVGCSGPGLFGRNSRYLACWRTCCCSGSVSERKLTASTAELLSGRQCGPGGVGRPAAGTWSYRRTVQYTDCI